MSTFGLIEVILYLEFHLYYQKLIFEFIFNSSCSQLALNSKMECTYVGLAVEINIRDQMSRIQILGDLKIYH